MKQIQPDKKAERPRAWIIKKDLDILQRCLTWLDDTRPKIIPIRSKFKPLTLRYDKNEIRLTGNGEVHRWDVSNRIKGHPTKAQVQEILTTISKSRPRVGFLK